MFKYWFEGLIFILFFSALILVPCALIAIIGTKLINNMGQYPSRMGEFQMKAAWKIILVETVSFLMLGLFFHIFSD